MSSHNCLQNVSLSRKKRYPSCHLLYLFYRSDDNPSSHIDEYCRFPVELYPSTNDWNRVFSLQPLYLPERILCFCTQALSKWERSFSASIFLINNSNYPDINIIGRNKIIYSPRLFKSRHDFLETFCSRTRIIILIFSQQVRKSFYLHFPIVCMSSWAAAIKVTSTMYLPS